MQPPPGEPTEAHNYEPRNDNRQHRQVFGWYRDEPLISDSFTLEQVGSHYTAQPCYNIGSHMMEQAVRNNVKYLTVCMPCYNEGKEEVFKTMLSLLKSIEFMKKARMNEDKTGRAVEQEFQRTCLVLVPIMDGVRAMDDSTKEWLSANFKGAFDSLIYPQPDKSFRRRGKLSRKKSFWAKKNKEVQVKVVCRKWWYYMHEVMPNSVVAADETIEDHLLSFYIVPIVKVQNHRKHNSHQWFFDSICQVLGDTCTFAFLTDCGTTYDPKCVAILMKELFLKPSLIGVTARQRVEWPNKYFHPCESSPWSWFQGDHQGTKSKKPCWKCYAAFLLSPCPIQGFEFEASLVTNLSIFNLVEVLPVMPGPCQLLHWQKMKRNEVVKEYFNLLFKGEINKKETLKFPPNYQRMLDDNFFSLDESDHDADVEIEPNPEDLERNIYLDETFSEIDATSDATGFYDDQSQVMSETVTDISNKHEDHLHDQQKEDDPHAPARTKLTFTEFLRTNMRLAEDRVLSFVSVFSTTYGTKWIPGSVFYYTPEIHWSTLLLQRRRWINGTFASYLFFLQSERAKNRMKARMFGHGFAKTMVMFLWKLNLFQMLLVFISPSVFGATAYKGLIECGKKFPFLFGWANFHVTDDLRLADIWIIFCYLVWAWWCLYSHFLKGGKMDEALCQFLAFCGFLFMIPIYLSLWRSVFIGDLTAATVLVVVSILAPAVISMAESVKCAKLYMAYLPWFSSLIVFYLILMPSYSFSRLYDTTWGNRATGTDSAIRASAEITMKRWNLVFVIFLIILNLFVTYGLISGFNTGFTFVLVFMFLVFVPGLIQLLGAVVFFLKLTCCDTYELQEEEKDDQVQQPGVSRMSSKFSMSSDGFSSMRNSMMLGPMRDSMSNIDTLLGIDRGLKPFNKKQQQDDEESENLLPNPNSKVSFYFA